VREAERPRASVVVASFSSREALGACLESLELGARGAEIVVATCLPASDVAALRQRFDARFIECPEESDHSAAVLRETRVFRLRTRGVEAARGRVIALLEDHCTVGPTWLDALCAQLEAEPAIAGGPVENARPDDAFAWALYWCEYAALLPPLDAGRVGYLSAVNAAYRRESLDGVRSVWAGGFFDNEVHDALIASGCPLRYAAAAGVRSELPFSFRSGAVHLYTGGCRYGVYRARRHPAAKRLLFVPAAVLVPWILLRRIWRTARERRPELTPTILRRLPWLLGFLFAWGAGEFVGALRGLASPGPSTTR